MSENSIPTQPANGEAPVQAPPVQAQQAEPAAQPPAQLTEEVPNGKVTGGKRKLTEWNKFVLKIFRDHRKTNKKYSYGQALKEASALKKAGKMSMKKEPKAPAKKSGKKTAKKTMKCKKEYV
uniref:Uncharacterized protein n=1 Tax=viral metagenome TaxID=1070528 RepID=A0A6C0E809_9ZZZZ